MKTYPSLKQSASCLLAACALAATAATSLADPIISRLTPPSALFTFGDATPPYIARFIKGQRFDLQATVSPDSGQSITSVEFKVDGNSVGTVPGGTNTSLVTTGLVTGLPTGTAIANYRAYANLTAGVHVLTATATQADSKTTTATGNFEVVDTPSTGKKAKNIIVMIGDGMGASHRTAARIVKNGVQQGKANDPLSMDLYPVTGMVETASLNSIITDSAPGAACYSTGNKSNNNQQGVFPDDTTNNGDNPRVELIGEFLARTQGKSLGIITTADVFDATPGAFASHTQARGAGVGICDYYLDEAVPASNLTVLMGGGRKWFLPSTALGTARSNSNDYIYPADVIAGWNLPTQGTATDNTRDLLANFQSAGFTYTANNTQLQAIPSSTTKLIGLFSYSNMNVAYDKINGRRGTSTIASDYGFPDQPMLDQMTDKALQVLSKNPNGFVLMIEGASIDKQAHNMDSERWILDTIEFDYAAERVRQFATNPANGETLAVITADHECAGVAIIGASTVSNSTLTTRASSSVGTGTSNSSGIVTTPGLRNGVVGTYEAAKFPSYPRATADDGYPASMDVDFKMLIGYAANADRYEDWLANARPLQDGQQPSSVSNPASNTPYESIRTTLPALPLNRDTTGNFLITGQVADTTAVHTGGDIPLSAIGRGSKLFTGYQDNTDVYFKAMQAAVGGATN